MEKKNIDWSKIGFGYQPTDWRWHQVWKNGGWEEGALTDDPSVVLSEAACVLHYSQSIFEGLKAYTTRDGRIVTFRPDLNARRLQDSARRLVMPELPVESFLHALDKVVRANEAWVPPYGTGCSLYVRPMLVGSGVQIGVGPAPEFFFRILVTPVGAYFKGGLRSMRLRVSEYDRAAPHGTGAIKAGLNYAMSLYQTEEAHRLGFAENVYLDPQTRTYVEETGGANILFVENGDTLVVPKSGSILPSITRRSLVEVGEKVLGLKVVERRVRFDEIGRFSECALCGTAAVLAPVGEIVSADQTVRFTDTMGPVCGKLRETLVGMQEGTVPAPEGWIHEIP